MCLDLIHMGQGRGVLKQNQKQQQQQLVSIRGTEDGLFTFRRWLRKKKDKGKKKEKKGESFHEAWVFGDGLIYMGHEEDCSR